MPRSQFLVLHITLLCKISESINIEWNIRDTLPPSTARYRCCRIRKQKKKASSAHETRHPAQNAVFLVRVVPDNNFTCTYSYLLTLRLPALKNHLNEMEKIRERRRVRERTKNERLSRHGNDTLYVKRKKMRHECT